MILLSTLKGSRNPKPEPTSRFWSTAYGMPTAIGILEAGVSLEARGAFQAAPF